MKLFYGVGYNDKMRPTKIMGINRPIYHYNIWKKMLMRCYDPEFHLKHESYSACSVSDNFKSYTYFYDWCEKQKGFGSPNFDMDKDIISKGNKIYSERDCVFVPKEINQLFVNCKKSRGLYPIGVNFDSFANRFKSALRVEGKSVNLGRFDDPLEAFSVYKISKEKHIKKLAEKWKSQIDPRAYEALMNYKVEITD